MGRRTTVCPWRLLRAGECKGDNPITDAVADVRLLLCDSASLERRGTDPRDCPCFVEAEATPIGERKFHVFDLTSSQSKRAGPAPHKGSN